MAAEQPGTEDALEAAAKRLERAGSLFDFDRSKLADELDTAKSRESELEEAGREASEALGRAIDELRGALEKSGAA
jgi:hypothetical protein